MSITITRKIRTTLHKGGGMAKTSKYKVGAIVRLKSGGPSMTVNSIRDSDGHVWCSWFAGNKLQSGRFSPDSIGLEDDLDPLKKLKRSAT